MPNVTIDVTGAQDANGNAQQDYTAEAEFSIDTLNPTVTAREVSDLQITDADTGEGTFQVTVTFNRRWTRRRSNPTLTFAPALPAR